MAPRVRHLFVKELLIQLDKDNENSLLGLSCDNDNRATVHLKVFRFSPLISCSCFFFLDRGSRTFAVGTHHANINYAFM
jgi:hypothetical protein